MGAILVVDDESAFLDSVSRLLRIEGYEDVTAVSDPREVPMLLQDRSFDAALVDVVMPEIDGMEILQRIKEVSPRTECVMVTAITAVPTVVKAMRLGAYDYVTKPLVPEQLVKVLDRALEHGRLIGSLMLKNGATPTERMRKPEAFAQIVTAAPSMIRMMHEAELHSASDLPILITGETGVGKELVARAIHAASKRSKGPFVAVNMLSLSMNLFESEFFGHARGAFTGADRDKVGYLAKAKGGTLFLDEIGDLPLEIQGKLLRILQEGEYTPVGSTGAEIADARFLAATNQDLTRLVADGRFRRDLFYRLQFAVLELPPLRKRPGDLRLLANTFLERFDGPGRRLSEQAMCALERHDWPGNVRELKAVIESASNLAEKGTIEPGHLRLPPGRGPGPGVSGDPGDLDGCNGALTDVERRHILRVYDSVDRNKTRAAKVLGIGLQTLHRKLRTYGVT